MAEPLHTRPPVVAAVEAIATRARAPCRQFLRRVRLLAVLALAVPRAVTPTCANDMAHGRFAATATVPGWVMHLKGRQWSFVDKRGYNWDLLQAASLASLNVWGMGSTIKAEP